MDIVITPELQKYYENRIEMMSGDAWRDLVEDVAYRLSAANDISSIKDEKELHFRRGEISIMRWIIGLEELTTTQLKGEDNADSA